MPAEAERSQPATVHSYISSRERRRRRLRDTCPLTLRDSFGFRPGLGWSLVCRELILDDVSGRWRLGAVVRPIKGCTKDTGLIAPFDSRSMCVERRCLCRFASAWPVGTQEGSLRSRLSQNFAAPIRRPEISIRAERGNKYSVISRPSARRLQQATHLASQSRHAFF